VDQDVLHRNLVVENPKQQDILRESGQYYQDTRLRRFEGDVLGYCTPVSISYYCLVTRDFIISKCMLYIISIISISHFCPSGMEMDTMFQKHFMVSLQWYHQYGSLYPLVIHRAINYPLILSRISG
jgi:hypothetical protein